jgi:hypothetical protein
MVRTRSLRTQSARHRVDHGTICGRSCAISGHHKPLCACVDRIFINPKFVAPVARKNSGAAGSRYLETLDREVRAAVANGLSLEDTLKVATAEAYSGYKLYPWTHKQINVPHAYRRIKGLE